MNWEQVKDYWKRLQSKIKPSCERVSNEEIRQIGSIKDKSVGKFRKRYERRKARTEKPTDESFTTQ